MIKKIGVLTVNPGVAQQVSASRKAGYALMFTVPLYKSDNVTVNPAGSVFVGDSSVAKGSCMATLAVGDSWSTPVAGGGGNNVNAEDYFIDGDTAGTQIIAWECMA